MLELPLPDSEAAKISHALTEHIHQAIEANGGKLPFSQYMQMALYAPGLGYYSAGAQKFGPSGDFVTAPELSPLFANCLARFCQSILASVPQSCILEFGAGSGRLACDLLTALAELDCLPERYIIIEVSPDLRARQTTLLKESCPELIDRIEWHSELPETAIEGVILANEVLDAMPVTLFEMNEDDCFEAHVSWQDSHFVFTNEPADADLTAQCQALKKTHFPSCEHYRSEINTWISPWIKSLSNSLKKGVVLLIDYGFPRSEYYHPQRTQGTVMCHYQHRAHSNPLILPGLQDITAHVDFTHVAESADECGLSVSGFTSQAFFLLGAGISDFVGDAPNAATNQVIKTLTYPSEMGDLFKVMALTRDWDDALLGFDLADYRYRL